MCIDTLIQQLCCTHRLDQAQWAALLRGAGAQEAEHLAQAAQAEAVARFGKKIYVRGLIEFTNYCRNDCYYCGIRRSNAKAQRYRLTPEDIFACCAEGYDLGFRTFVLQGGEDAGFSDDLLCQTVETIKKRWSDCALTLSVGERDRGVYQSFFDAGADRYLLRHETANEAHYHRLHPAALSLARRKECLWTLKEIGFQVGAGFMVGAPGQTAETLAEDLIFLQQLQPHMVGIGPFLPHKDTPFAQEAAGSTDQTLLLLSCVRLMLPQVLLPATTALGTAAADGRERGILAGANVVMPNLSPLSVRKKYMLYDNKICTGDESAQCRSCLQHRLSSIGYEWAVERGDSPLLGTPRTSASTVPAQSG